MVLYHLNIVPLKKSSPKKHVDLDERSDKIEKNPVDCFSISLLVLKIFGSRFEKLWATILICKLR